MKQKNSELIAYILLAVLAVVIIGSIVYMVKGSVDRTSDAAKHILDQSEELAEEMEDYEITKYDGEKIRGDEVVNIIKEQLVGYLVTETAPIYIQVTTVVSGTTYTNIYVNKQHLADIKNFSIPQYFIAKNAYYSYDVVYSVNKAILGVKIVQK